MFSVAPITLAPAFGDRNEFAAMTTSEFHLSRLPGGILEDEGHHRPYSDWAFRNRAGDPDQGPEVVHPRIGGMY